ncbi:hypothetical protein V6N12_047328 [Hibiscus sabdariffa]|uniref:Xylanase inhibitor N-terminal domain-containing protein n=1 Tax=Hibiscus sabdariffa TaxID=183260 RepID=A0ABR2DDF1_9ROSI
MGCLGRDNWSCLGRYLGRSSDFDRASYNVIGLSLSPNNLLSFSYKISLGGISAGTQSAALADSSSLVKSCISTALICFNLHVLLSA